MRIAINGDLIAPPRGTPPDCPEGYIRIEPFIFRKIINCVHRTQKLVHSGCCGSSLITMCKGVKIDVKECTECDQL